MVDGDDTGARQCQRLEKLLAEECRISVAREIQGHQGHRGIYAINDNEIGLDFL